MQSGDKIDSLEVTIALEIVSHFLHLVWGGFKNRQNPDLTSHVRQLGRPLGLVQQKYFIHCWRCVLQVSSAANVWW